MTTYSVRQIAEKLNTNPETVRRWIRDGKLKAEQTSRRDGNVVTEYELERFIKNNPKYSLLPISIGMAVLSPLTMGITASILKGCYKRRENTDKDISTKEIKAYLHESIASMNEGILQKEELIKNTQKEIDEISQKIESYTQILENEQLLSSLSEDGTDIEGTDN